TRVSADKAAHVVSAVDRAEYREAARSIFVPSLDGRKSRGRVAVVAAGTSDLPIASEVAVTLEFLEIEPLSMTDVGVAGLPRTLAAAKDLGQVDVAVVVAGMEGALPGVLAGLIDRPIIAVPTSVGYGVGFGGYVAMMAMLASCSPGVSVVNIDNGFGAAVAASRIVGARG
ncbi:MAG: nickel pincer cofactor biosynthesis protein LarB, partial [Deltaproteobacteria bacterium]|nr:nickel pincer cofactor biosynthesis protein LarB [Deltaproteobacteria bacterium]